MDPIVMRLEALRVHFETHFDHGWLALLMEDLPVDSSTVRQIRDLLGLRVVYPEDLAELRFGVRRLESFALDLERHLLPVLRDRLGVSGFRGFGSGRGSVDRVHRQFVCMTFPHNLERLCELTSELKSVVESFAS